MTPDDLARQNRCLALDIRALVSGASDYEKTLRQVHLPHEFTSADARERMIDLMLIRHMLGHHNRR